MNAPERHLSVLETSKSSPRHWSVSSLLEWAKKRIQERKKAEVLSSHDSRKPLYEAMVIAERSFAAVQADLAVAQQRLALARQHFELSQLADVSEMTGEMTVYLHRLLEFHSMDDVEKMPWMSDRDYVRALFKRLMSGLNVYIYEK